MIGFIEWAWVDAPWLLCIVLVVITLIYVGAGRGLWFYMNEEALNSPALGKFEGWARFFVIALWPLVVASMLMAVIIVLSVCLILAALGMKIR